MKAGKNFFREKLPFLENQKKQQNDFSFKIDFLNIIQAVKKVFFKTKCSLLVFLPLGLKKNINLKRGSSHWFLNQNKKIW